MTALIMSSRQTNTNKAGQTSTIESRAEDVPHVIQPAVQDTFSDLGNIFSGGVHPETTLSDIIQPASTAIVKGSDSVRGRLGGLVARAHTTIQPGPAGPSHATKEIVSLPSKVIDKVTGKNG